MKSRVLIECQISFNHGESWRGIAICGPCIKEVDPPARLKQIGQTTGAKECDWCEAKNELYQTGKVFIRSKAHKSILDLYSGRGPWRKRW